MAERILVTGAAGFCGTHLCDLLSRFSKIKIFGTYHSARKRPLHSFFDWIPLNLESQESVEKVIRQVVPTKVYHLAGISNPSQSWEKIDNTFASNSLGTVFLLEAMRRFSKKGRILIVSTSHVSEGYFRGYGMVGSVDKIWPISPYGMSKALCEMAALNYADAFKMDVLIARSFNHIGVGQSTEYAIASWCKQVAEIESGKKPNTLHVGNLDVRRDFLPVHDVVCAYQTIMGAGQAGTVYPVAAGKAETMQHYLQMLISLAKKKINVQQVRERMRRSEVRIVVGDTTRLSRLGWQAQGSVKETLKAMLDERRGEVRT